MKSTDNLGLALYEPTDKFNITGEQNSLNANMKIVDKVITEKIQDVADAASEVTGFKKEVSDEVDKLSTDMGGLVFSITEKGLLHIERKQTNKVKEVNK